jgi:hypothetical protein
MVCLLTVLEIQGNETSAHPYQDKNSGKWGYDIVFSNRNHPPLVTVEAVYDSEKTAQTEGTNIINIIKNIDLSPEKGKLEKLFKEDKNIFQDIIEDSKNPLKLNRKK